MESKCSIHQKSLKLICLTCNIILCSRCTPLHNGHSFDHIDDIKSNLKNININNNNNNNNINNKIKGIFGDVEVNLNCLFNDLKLKVEIYKEILQTENEITKKFKELHEYLVLQEHRIKKPISNDKDIIEQQINNQVNELKSLNTILNQINYQHPSADENDNNSNSDSQSDHDSDLSIIDSTDKYQISYIIQSLGDSVSFTDFVNKNSKTIFYYSGDISLSEAVAKPDGQLLQMILQHKSIAGRNALLVSACNSQNVYRFRVNNQLIKNIMAEIQESVGLSLISREKLELQMARVTYLFSTDNNCTISLIPICNFGGNVPHDELELELLDSIKSGDRWSFNSVIAVGGFVYRFGGGMRKSNRYQRFSIASKSIDVDAEMGGVDECNCLSVCFDGKEYIYMFDGNIKANTIIFRYSVRTMKFEKYATIPNTSYHHLSFFYKGQIFSVIPIQKRIIRFDPVNCTTANLPIDLLEYVPNARISCTDGKGNIYIQSSTNFIKINVETYQVKTLSPTKNISANNQLIFHQAGPNENLIYSLQGKDHNFVYSIESNKWKQILKDDQCDRAFCASVVVTKK